MSYADAASRNPRQMTEAQMRCVTCASRGILPLTCEAQHKICAGCLPNNIAKFGSKPEYIYNCPECTKPATDMPVWIFVDNSNIWIEAKKLASKIKKFTSNEDHRLRISIGGLTDVVANERQVIEATLYGSEPPKIDSVWEKIRQHENWYVKTKQKNYITHKEKEIDSQLVADVTEIASDVPPFQRGTIVLLSGDADMYPAVEKILAREGWKVEIYTWEQSLSTRLRDISKKHPERVICEPLDNHLEEVTFTNKVLPEDKTKRFEKCSAVMLMEEECFPEHVIEDGWWNQLESIAQWPVEYWWIMKNKNEVTNNLVLVFRGAREVKTYCVSNFVKILSDDIAAAKEKPLLPYVVRVETYIGYKKRQGHFDAIMKSGRHLNAFEYEHDSNFVAVTPAASADIKVKEQSIFGEEKSAASSDDSFQSVPPSRVGGKQKDCIFGKNCFTGNECKYAHSQSDTLFFDKHGGKGKPIRKVKQCQKYPNCDYAKHLCNFAHGDSDAWCLGCRKQGHFTDNCPKKQ